MRDPAEIPMFYSLYEEPEVRDLLDAHIETLLAQLCCGYAGPISRAALLRNGVRLIKEDGHTLNYICRVITKYIKSYHRDSHWDSDPKHYQCGL